MTYLPSLKFYFWYALLMMQMFLCWYTGHNYNKWADKKIVCIQRQTFAYILSHAQSPYRINDLRLTDCHPDHRGKPDWYNTQNTKASVNKMHLQLSSTKWIHIVSKTWSRYYHVWTNLQIRPCPVLCHESYNVTKISWCIHSIDTNDVERSTNNWFLCHWQVRGSCWLF